MSKRILKKLLKIFIYVHVFLMLGLIFTHCTFTHFANKSYKEARKNKPYDVVIVPGVPYDGDKTSSVMKMRVFWAKHLYDSGYTKNIIFSGSSVYTPYVEGVVMKIMADSLGIPPDRTFSETKAEHSTENVYYSWKMAKAMGFKKIALASDHFQSGMLRSFMKRYCPGMKAVPIIFDKLNIDEQRLPRIDSTSAYVANFIPITEKESFWLRFRYTIGKRIKDEVRAEKEKAGLQSEGSTGN